ncbi:MAG: hypothetical protein AAF235_09395 [Planctomycetota bacterium]
MRLNNEQREWLAQAFARLSAGSWRGFEDTLWLGFGNQWQPLLANLERQDFVELCGPSGDEPRITPRGYDLLAQLRGEPIETPKAPELARQVA